MHQRSAGCWSLDSPKPLDPPCPLWRASPSSLKPSQMMLPDVMPRAELLVEYHWAS